MPPPRPEGSTPGWFSASQNLNEQLYWDGEAWSGRRIWTAAGYQVLPLTGVEEADDAAPTTGRVVRFTRRRLYLAVIGALVVVAVGVTILVESTAGSETTTARTWNERAAAINARPSDLPAGYRGERRPSTVMFDIEDRTARCAGVRTPIPSHIYLSKEFFGTTTATRGSLASRVAVFASSADATAFIYAANLPKFHSCLGSAAAREFHRRGFGASAATLDSGLMGGTNFNGWRSQVILSAAPSLYNDIEFLMRASGSAVVETGVLRLGQDSNIETAAQIVFGKIEARA
jgi:hypothetical protein